MNLCLCEDGAPRTAAALLEAARAACREDGPVVVACHTVEFLDTAVLQVLIALRQALAIRGRALLVTGLSESARRYLNLAGLAGTVVGPRGSDHVEAGRAGQPG